MNTFFAFTKRFAAFGTVVIAIMLTMSCTVVSPPQQGRGQVPQQWHPNMGPYGPGVPQMMPQGGPYGSQGYHPQMPGGNAGQLQQPQGRLSVVPGTGRTFDAKLQGATGVATWTLNGAPIKGSLVPDAAKQGLEQSLQAQDYKGPPITHKE